MIGRKVILLFCLAMLVVGVFAGLRFQYYIDHEELLSKGNNNISIEKPDLDSSSQDIYDALTFDNKPKEEVINSAPINVQKSPLTAKAYLVGNIDTGEIYLEKNSKSKLPVASISKLVTALVATNELSSSTILEISSSTIESFELPVENTGVWVGDKYLLGQAIIPMLISSSNILAETIASSTKRLDFIELMSSYSWEIGMPNTYFADASGLNERNMSSARDLFELSKYLYKYRPDVLGMTKIKQYTIATSTLSSAKIFNSTHPFINDNRFLGGKTGRTLAAGETMITVLDMGTKGKVAFIILGSTWGYREADTRYLINQL